MATPAADRVVLDTDVLLTATDGRRADHAQAVAALQEWPTTGIVLYTSGQILREYLSVATRPAAQNGLGMPSATAVANVRMLRERLRLMVEHEKVADRLTALLDVVDCSGKQVHDANIVATMLVHGIDTLCTGHVGDFARFGDRVRTVQLAG